MFKIIILSATSLRKARVLPGHHQVFRGPRVSPSTALLTAAATQLPEQPSTPQTAQGNQSRKALLPFLLQSGEVFFEGRADLVKQFHQGMTEKTGVCRFGVEVVGSRPARKKETTAVCQT